MIKTYMPIFPQNLAYNIITKYQPLFSKVNSLMACFKRKNIGLVIMYTYMQACICFVIDNETMQEISPVYISWDRILLFFTNIDELPTHEISLSVVYKSLKLCKQF